MNYKMVLYISLGIFFVFLTSVFVWTFGKAFPENQSCKFKNTEYKLLPGNEIKILSWNIGYASGLTNNTTQKLTFEKYTNNLSTIKETIKSEKPDIVALQEIDFSSDRSYKIDQSNFVTDGVFENILDCANWNINYVPFPYWPPSSHFGKIFSGQSTYSKLFIEKYEKIVFEKPKANGFFYNLFYLDRMALISKINIGLTNRPLILVNVHLEAFDVKARYLQVQKLLTELEKYKGLPIIIVGDFNTIPQNASKKNEFTDEPTADFTNDESFALLKSKFKTIYQERDDYLTFPSNAPTRQLDHVFYNEYIEPAGFKVLNVVPDSDIQPSDHLPIVFRFRLVTI